MQLGPGNWTLIVKGNTDAFLSAGGRNRDILAYQLERMVAGQEFSPDELAYWGIDVRALGPDDELIVVPGSGA